MFSTLLNEAQVRMAGPKTMLGDAIGLAVKHFKSSEEDQKVLILLTDGNDSGSQVPPIDAATIANNDGIVIYTIAVGNPRVIGEQELDLATLQKIINLTSGQFYHANSAVKLQQISFMFLIDVQSISNMLKRFTGSLFTGSFIPKNK